MSYKLKCQIFFKKHKVFLLLIVTVVMHMKKKKKIKEEESVELLKILVLINNIEEYQKIHNHA